LANDFPLLKHDLTAIRRNALVELLNENNEHDEAVVERAIELFVENRNLVDPFLYDDTIPCLEWLRSQGVRVAVVTNGTANLTQSPVLNSYLDLSLCAGETGAMKPSPVPFIAVLQRMDVCAARTLFVGDSYENDVVGSKKCGMHSVFLERILPEEEKNTLASSTSASTSNAQVMDFASPPISPFAYRPVRTPAVDCTLADVTVNTLEPSHFAEKLKAYFASKS